MSLCCGRCLPGPTPPPSPATIPAGAGADREAWADWDDLDMQDRCGAGGSGRGTAVASGDSNGDSRRAVGLSDEAGDALELNGPQAEADLRKTESSE
jgi:hypothetical protein